KTTPRLSSVAVSMEATFRHVVGDHLVHRTSVEGLAHRPLGTVRRPGCAPVCRLDDSGLLPFANGPRLTGTCAGRQKDSEGRAAVFLASTPELIRSNLLMRQAASPESRCRDG